MRGSSTSAGHPRPGANHRTRRTAHSGEGCARRRLPCASVDLAGPRNPLSDSLEGSQERGDSPLSWRQTGSPGGVTARPKAFWRHGYHCSWLPEAPSPDWKVELGVNRASNEIAAMKLSTLDSKLVVRLLAMPRRGKQLVVIAGDLISGWLSLWMAFTLRLEVWHWPTAQQLWIYAAVPALFVPIFVRFGPYRAIFRYPRPPPLQPLLGAAPVYGLLLLVLVLATFPAGVPRSIGVWQPIPFLVLVRN